MAGNGQPENVFAGHLVPARQKQRSVFTGVRLRQWGRWAVEIRVPRTYARVWIGAFETEREAALAYDAAIFCFCGENPPPPRKFNFPDAARPNIPENVRVQLTVNDIKDIAKKHARGLPLGPLPSPAGSTLDPVRVAAAAAGLNDSNPNDIDLNHDTTANANLVEAATDMLVPFVSEEELVADAAVAHTGYD